MDYKEFQLKIGKITIPKDELADKLIHGLDSIHFIGVIGKVVEDVYVMYDPVTPDEVMCLDIISLLELRGAARDKDYIVTCDLDLSRMQVRLAIHTTNNFLSDEDFDRKIKRL